MKIHEKKADKVPAFDDIYINVLPTFKCSQIYTFSLVSRSDETVESDAWQNVIDGTFAKGNMVTLCITHYHKLI